MNRQLKPLLLAASAVLLATACNDDNNGVDISRPIDLHLAPAAPLTAETRAAIDAPNFDSDDVVGLYLAWATDATAETGTAINASLVKNTKWCNGQFEGEPLYWQNTVSYHTIYAYYPHTADVTSDYKVAVSIKQDQNSETKAADYEASDVLWAKRTAVAQNNLQLPLGHCMSLVTVTLEKGEGYAETEDMPTIKKVELLKTGGFQLAGTMELADGDVTATGSSTATPLTTYDYGTDYRAILLPDELISATEAFIRITLADNTTYTYKPATDITTTANTKYNFALKLNKAGVDLSGLTIGKWGETGPINGDAGMDIPATQTPSN